MQQSYDNPLLIVKWRAGTEADPFVPVSDTKMIINNLVYLEEMPHTFERMQIDGYAEVSRNGTNSDYLPASNEFVVDYQNAFITFNPSENGKTIVSQYMGMGMILISPKRVVLQDGSGNIIETLQDFIDESKADLQSAQDKIDFLQGEINDVLLKSVYDTNNDGIVDHAALADNATNLNGQPATYYAHIDTSATNGNLVINGVDTPVYVLPSTLPATMITTDSNDRFVTDAQVADFTDKYTQAETDAKFTNYTANSPWKQTVQTFTDIAMTYPTPQDGWVVSVTDTESTYRYASSSSSWILISANSIPVATESQNGLMSSDDKTKLDNVSSIVTSQMSNKADKVPTAVANNFTAFDSTGNIKDSGFNNTSFAPQSEMVLKADKVSSPTNGNFSGLDQYGNLTDSGYNPNSFAPATAMETLLTKADKVTGAKNGNFAGLNSGGDLIDSGYNSGSFAPINHTHPDATETTDGFMSEGDKRKLDGVQTGAQVNQNVYANIAVGGNTLKPAAQSDTLTISTTGALTVTSNPTNGSFTLGVDPTQFAPSSHVGAGGNAHALVTETVAGFMSTADKQKLDQITVNSNGQIAQNAYASFGFYDASGASLGVITSSAPQDSFYFNESKGIVFTPSTTNESVTLGLDWTQTATDTTNGFMGSSDKAKLDGITGYFGVLNIAGTAISASLLNDTFAFNAGTNVTLTPSGKSVTIAVNIPSATNTAIGGIQLSGALTGSASSPQLTSTGVTSGTYNNPTITVGADGRITSVSVGTVIGDMLKSVYDTNGNGIVDHSENADALGGQSISYFAKASDVGILTSLTTSAKSSIVAAINSNVISINTNSTNIGNMTSLQTTAKDTLVNAINEIKSSITSNAATINDNATNASSTWSSYKINSAIGAAVIPWAQIGNKPSSAVGDIDDAVTKRHTHVNKSTLDSFGVGTNGNIQWSGADLGNMLKSTYDTNGNGIVDSAETLQGLSSTITELNYVHGVTSNIQQQINSISQSVQFKGHSPSYAQVNTLYTNPANGWMVVVDTDETNNNHKTYYIYNSSSSAWQFIGVLDPTPDASSTTKGAVQLTGALAGTATNPQLSTTGVTAGTYSYASITVGADGRITSASNGLTPITIDDSNVSTVKTWSSNNINNLLNQKLNVSDPHVHYPSQLGTKTLDETNLADGYVIGYNATSGKLVYTPKTTQTFIAAGGQNLTGNVSLVCGTGITMTADPTGNSITINSTGGTGSSGTGGGGVPQYAETATTINVPAGQSISQAINVGFNKFTISSVSFSNDGNQNITLSLYDKTSNGDLVYQYSNTSDYRIVNVSCQDKDSTTSSHAVITNNGMVATNVTIKLRVTSLS